MSNIYDTAYELEKNLREASVFTELSAAYTAMREDQVAFQLFEEFRNVQVGLEQKQMTGEAITDEDVASAQAVAEKASGNEVIQSLMAKEQQLSQLMEEVNAIITKPLQELYAPAQD